MNRPPPRPRRAALEDARLRELLERIGDSAEVNQRGLATELGVALGLVNAYLKRCVRKGLVKVKEVPARRYRYYLTPKGFAEKSRLTLQFLGDSFIALRRASASFERLYAELAAAGARTAVLCGDDDMVEVGVLASLAGPIRVVGVCDPFGPSRPVRGVPPVALADAAADAWIVASTRRSAEVFRRLSASVPPERVRAPDVLRLDPSARVP
jgi:DNA-binding MarR family transcriptional regulator